MNNVLVLKNNEAEHVNVIRFPDGQQLVEIDLDHFDVKVPITIKCRIKYFHELEVLLCIIAALRKHDRIISEIEFVYLFGMRSDRSFKIGQPNYFRDVIAPVIRLTGLAEHQIKINWAHALSNLLDIPAVENIGYHTAFEYKEITINGDASFNYGSLSFNKKRNMETGHINSISLSDNHITILQNSINDTIVIADDLCDGGATFIAEAQYLRDMVGYKGKLILAIYHGIFSKGFDVLLQHFDEIHTTNSYQDFPDNLDNRIKITKVI